MKYQRGGQIGAYLGITVRIVGNFTATAEVPIILISYKLDRKYFCFMVA
jgi:hypothetical protein